MAPAAVGEPRRHDLVEDEECVVRGRRLAQEAEEGEAAGDGAAGAEEGFDEDGGEAVRREGVEKGAGAGDVVVGAEDPVVGEVHVRAVVAGGEGDGAAVVAAFEDEDLPAAGPGEGGGEGARVGLGAGVGEADEFHRRNEPFAHDFRELFLIAVGAAEVDAALQSGGDGAPDGFVAVAVDARGVFAEEVDVFVVVEGFQCGAAAAPEG